MHEDKSETVAFIEKTGAGRVWSHSREHPERAAGGLLSDSRVTEALAILGPHRAALDAAAAESDRARDARIEQALQDVIAAGATQVRDRAAEQATMGEFADPAPPRLDAGAFGPVLEGLSIADPDHETTTIIDTMTHIRAWPEGSDLKDSDAGPYANWAKYHFGITEEGAITTSGEARLSFYCLWQNPRDAVSFVSVATQLRCLAWVDARADGSGVAAWAFGPTVGRAKVTCELRLWPLASAGASAVVAEKEILTLQAIGGFTGDHAYSLVDETVTTAGTGFPVPPRSAILIESAFVTSYEVLGARVAVTAGLVRDRWQIECPFVTVSHR